MKYILADKDWAAGKGISLCGKRELTDGRAVLNEKEVLACASLSGDLEARVRQLYGEAVTLRELREQIIKGEISYGN